MNYITYVRLTAVIGGATVAMIEAEAVAQPSFQRLAFLEVTPGRYSLANDLSHDGTVVVGYSNDTAVFWRPRDGSVQSLGRLQPPFDDASQANAVSGDGRFVAGGGSWRSIGPSISCAAFGSTEARELVALHPLPDGKFNFTWTTDISDNGRVVVGYMGFGPCRWVDGVWEALLPGQGFASAVSADGSVIVGVSDQFEATSAFRWTAEEVTFIGDLEGGGERSVATGISHNGLYITGRGESFDKGAKSVVTEAFLWSHKHGMIGLGDLPGGSFSSNAVAVTDDGRVVLGVGTTGWAGGTLDTAFMWTPDRGIRALQDVLVEDFGLTLDGWKLSGVPSITPDGRYVCGHGVNPEGRTEAYIVDLGPTPPPCPPDFNADATLNSQDFFDYLIAFFDADTRADFNRDSSVNSQDFFDFLTALFEGC